MADSIFTAETFADHLAEYRLRVDFKRGAIEANPRDLRAALGATTERGKQFWAGMRAAISRRQQPVDEALARACERAELRLGTREWLDAARHGESAALIAFIEGGFPHSAIAIREPARRHCMPPPDRRRGPPCACLCITGLIF